MRITNCSPCQQPARRRQCDIPRWPFRWACLPQHGVHQPRCRSFSRLPHQFHAFTHRCVIRNAVQPKLLVKSHPESDAHRTVEFAADGKSALERARELRPHIVVTEIMVPVLDGLNLCRLLKSDPQTAHARVLIFSHLHAEDRAREVGADAFLLKPISEELLIETVERLIASSKPRSEETRND